MNVSRLRRGWRISVSDSEMELIKTAVRLGMETLREDDADLTILSLAPHVLRVLHSDRWMRVPGGPFVPDEDRRPENQPEPDEADPDEDQA